MIDSTKSLEHIISLSDSLSVCIDSYLNISMTDEQRKVATQSSVLASELSKKLRQLQYMSHNKLNDMEE